MLQKCYQVITKGPRTNFFGKMALSCFLDMMPTCRLGRAFTDYNGRLTSLPVTKLSLQLLEIVCTFAAKCVRYSFPEVCVCVERGMVSKHTRVTGSGIALSMSFFFFFVLCDPLYDTVSTCVQRPTNLQGITNTGSDRTSRTFQSSGGPRPLSKLSH